MKTYGPYRGTLVSQIDRSFSSDWVCGCKWSEIETNFKHQNLYRTSRQSQRRFDRLQMTLFGVDMGFMV